MRLAQRLVRYLEQELHLTQDQAEIINYGLLSFMATTLNLLVLAAIGALLGVLKEALFITLVVMAFRKVSGGAHCDTLLTCTVTGTAVITAAAACTRLFAAGLASSPLFLAGAPALALVSTFLFAPADVPQKPITSARQRRILRTLSFLLLLGWSILGTSLWLTKNPFLYYYAGGNLGILWQSLLLTPAGYSFMSIISRLFSFIRQ